MKKGASLLILIGILLLAFGLFLKPLVNLKPSVKDVTFSFDSTQTEGTFVLPMPEDGLVCLVDDMNHRSGPVAKPVEDYWDVEGSHRIIGLAGDGRELFQLNVLSRKQDDGLPVEAKSYCEAKISGAPVTIAIRRTAEVAVWSLSIN